MRDRTEELGVVILDESHFRQCTFSVFLVLLMSFANEVTGHQTVLALEQQWSHCSHFLREMGHDNAVKEIS
jgi:hypothetical protein